MPVPDKKKLSILAALAAAGAGLMLGLMKSLVGRRLGRKASAVAVGAKPDAALGEDAEHDEETFVEAHAAAQQAQVKASPKPAAAAGHRVPFAPPEPRAASHGEVAALDIEANCDAIRLDEIAREILARPPQEIGIRTLVTGVDIAIQPASEALGLARRLTAGGKSVVLVDWSTEGHGLAELLAVKSEPGINEVLIGRASFEDVVQCLLEVGGNELHVIAAGADLTGKADALDPDVINLVLDALDEAYDHIVVVGRHDEARELFESILGRFDVGVLIGEAGARANVQPGTFLGFDVTEIVTFDCTRPSPVPASTPKAAKAAAGKAAAVADGPAPVSQAAIARALRSSAQRAAAGGNRA